MTRSCFLAHQVGKEVCRVGTTDFEGELAKGRGREIAKDLDGSRSYHLVIVNVDGQRHVSCDQSSIFAPTCIHSYSVCEFYYIVFDYSSTLGLLELTDPLGDKVDLKLVNIPNPGRFFRMITQAILIIMMDPIY